MSRNTDHFVVFNIRETYHELGEYDFKIVLDPAKFKTSQLLSYKMLDSDMKSMDFSVQKWGRKLNCRFKIDPNVSDGVSYFYAVVTNSKGEEEKIQLKFWVIKP